MRGRGTTVAWALVAALALVAPPHARADDDDSNKRERERLMEEVRKLLGTIEAKLDRVPGSNGYYEIDDAKSTCNDVKSKVSDLSRYASGDSQAEKMVSNYPGYADKLKESLDYLKQMKDAQVRQADARLWDSCQDWERKLREDVDRWDDDPRGLEELPKIGDEARYKVEDKLKKADETHNSMASSWKSYARNFSESEWSGISSELRDAVDNTWDRWREKHEATHMKCDDLAKGRSHPLVVKALEKLGSSKGARKETLERLQQRMAQVASSLDGVVDRKDTREIESAMGETDPMYAVFETLERTAGKDNDARDKAKKGQEESKKLRRALEVLKLEKELQYLLDKGPEKCGQAGKELDDIIKRYIGDPDANEEGRAELTSRAEKLASEMKGRLDAAAKKLEETERYRDEVLRWSYEDDDSWKRIRERLHGGANAIASYVKVALANAQTACNELAQGVEGQRIKDGLTRLGSSNKSASDELNAVKAEWDLWKKTRRSQFVQWYKDDTYAVRTALCAVPDSVGNPRAEPQVQAVINEILSRSQNRLTSSWSELMDRSARLIARLDDLKTKGGLGKDEAKERTALRSKVKAARERLEKRQASGLLLGTNDPYTRSKLEYGKTAHKSMQSNCASKEVDTTRRSFIDCVRIESGGTCNIVEIKPKHLESLGRKEAKDYEDDIMSVWNGGRGIAAFDSGDLVVFKQCMDIPSDEEAKNGKKPVLKISNSVETYDFCPPTEEAPQANDVESSDDN